MKKAIYWLTNDLRISCNPALEYACKQFDELAFVYVLDPCLLSESAKTPQLMGKRQCQFVIESLLSLSQQLGSLGHDLVVLEGKVEHQLTQLMTETGADHLVTAHQFGFYERQVLIRLQQCLPKVSFEFFWQNTLFESSQVAQYTNTIQSFSKFRSRIEKKQIPVMPIDKGQITVLPKQLVCEVGPQSQRILHQWQKRLDDDLPKQSLPFLGGELAAQHHLVSFFNSGAASTYKQTRNELDGWQNSTKFSPYLAIGDLSARQIWHAVTQYEQQGGANESTYWIKFELLWREYFQWLSLKLGKRLFHFKGLRDSCPLTSFYPQRFKKWCVGNTPYPLVNALMTQLNLTGYLSNRGRQVVASCLVNELQVDWRYGAEYFQQQLIDHDVASNWGNWQYIAGVGVDPRGGRHFNIEKQTRMYDPEGRYIRMWQGSSQPHDLDSNDHLDRPILAEIGE